MRGRLARGEAGALAPSLSIQCGTETGRWLEGTRPIMRGECPQWVSARPNIARHLSPLICAYQSRHHCRAVVFNAKEALTFFRARTMETAE